MWPELYISDYLALAALIVATMRYTCLRQSGWQGFVPYLCITLVVEWGAAWDLYRINGSDHWVFNIQTVVEFCFFSFLFYKVLKHRPMKALAFFSALLFPFLLSINCIFLKGFNSFATYASAIGSVLTITFACTYFYELLQIPDETKFLALPFFWVCIGLLFYNAGDFVNTVIFPHIAYMKDKTLTKIFRTIEYNLNTLLYCCFIIAFLCQRKTTNSYT